MSTIIFEGNTYTFGATVSTNPGTGTTSYVFGGLSSGSTYGFIIWAFNGVGPSSIVGPSIKQTLSISPFELRDDFGAVAWSWPGNVQQTLQYDTGSEINLLGGSQEISPPFWNTSGISRINSGITLPNGITDGMILILSGNNVITQAVTLLESFTYYFSWYENRTFNSQQINLNIFHGAGLSTNLTGRQILPQFGTFISNNIKPLGPTAGQTGWVRYAYEIRKIGPTNEPIFLGWRTDGGAPSGTYYIGGPQLEIAT